MAAAAAVKRGAFLVFEGVDHCGKTTQARLLVESLIAGGHPAKFQAFPDRTTPVGQLCDKYLRKEIELDDHAVHLLFAANRWEAATNMLQLLNAGTTLIVDRYSFSGVAFSAAKDTLPMEWCKLPEIGLPKPDAVLYLELPMEEVEGRGDFGRERYEVSSFQSKVRKNFADLREPNWVLVDARGTVEEVGARIMAIAQDIIALAATQRVGELWSEQLAKK